MYSEICTAKSILYLCDNAGEIVTDKLFSAIRYGGDEFILLLTCPKSGNILSQKLQRIVAAISEATTIESTVIQLSISYGNARYGEDGTTSDELFKVADQRMYEQKRALSR